MEETESHLMTPEQEDMAALVRLSSRIHSKPPSRFRYGNNSTPKLKSGVADEVDDESLQRLEQQLMLEENMEKNEDFATLQREFLEKREDYNVRIRYALHLTRSSKREHHLEAERILRELHRSQDVNMDLNSQRAVLYYSAIVNFKMKFYPESQRYVRELLKLEPESRQANRFLTLLRFKCRRKLIVVLDKTYESGLAFSRALELVDPHIDEMVLVSFFTNADVDPLLTVHRDSDGMNSHREAKAEELGKDIQKKYQDICEDRGIAFNYVIELGDAKEAICSIIEDEQITTVIVPFGSTHSHGLFSRLRLTNLSEYLYEHAKCDVLIVKE